MKELVCVTGLPGAGKSIASDFFVEKGFQYVRFGQVVLDEVMKRGLAVKESNERDVREELRDKYGMAAMAILNLPKFNALLEKGNVIGDGLYSFEEYKVLKKEFGNQLVVVAIYAPPRMRYERLTQRKRSVDDKIARFRPLTIEEAESRDLAEIENLNKGGTIAMADFTILNIKDIEHFKRELEETFNEVQKYT